MKKEWYEDTEFWEAVAPFLFGEERWALTPAEVEHITTLLNVGEGAAILDLCCGPGRHSLELARRNYAVTGVDRNVTFLQQARKKAESEGLLLEFVDEDMRNFCRQEAFDAVLLLYTSFGYFEEQDQNFKVLLNVYQSLRKGGVFIIEVMGKEVLARIFRERDWGEKNGIIHLEERKIIENWSKIENRWIIIDKNTRKEFNFTHWIYSAQELSSLLHKCGFNSIGVYGSLEGGPYDNTARRLVTVARK